MKLFSKIFKKTSIIVGITMVFTAMIFLLVRPSMVFSNSSEISGSRVFKNYKTEWPSSDGPRANDPYRSLLQLTPISFNSAGNHGTGSNFVDINGDGLVDLLYINHGTSYFNSQNIGWVQKYAVLIHKGNGLDVIYKCVVHNDNFVQLYGDCAAQ